MGDIRAADLPVGSIVATDHVAFIRALGGPGVVWHGTDKKRYDDAEVDEMLATIATVLQVGPDGRA